MDCRNSVCLNQTTNNSKYCNECMEFIKNYCFNIETHQQLFAKTERLVRNSIKKMQRNLEKKINLIFTYANVEIFKKNTYSESIKMIENIKNMELDIPAFENFDKEKQKLIEEFKKIKENLENIKNHEEIKMS